MDGPALLELYNIRSLVCLPKKLDIKSHIDWKYQTATLKQTSWKLNVMP